MSTSIDPGLLFQGPSYQLEALLDDGSRSIALARWTRPTLHRSGAGHEQIGIVTAMKSASGKSLGRVVGMSYMCFARIVPGGQAPRKSSGWTCQSRVRQLVEGTKPTAPDTEPALYPRSVCWFTTAFDGLRCHPLTRMLLNLRLSADSIPSALTNRFQSLFVNFTVSCRLRHV